MKTLEVVCGIIRDDKGYLIARRKSKVHNDIWEFPGGKVEANETQEEAIIRELKEELNLTCKVESYLTSIVDQRSDLCIHVHAYICEKVSGTLQNHAHHEIRFVSLEELYTYAFEPCDRAIMDALKVYEQTHGND